MVGHLISLKWRYVLATLRTNMWAMIGIILGLIYLLGALTGWGVLHTVLASEHAETSAGLSMLAGIVLTAAWVLVPIFFSSLDGTLDVSRFVLFPIGPKDLQKGQFFGGFIGLPGIGTVCAMLLGTLGLIHAPAIIFYIPGVILGLGQLMIAARLANMFGAYLHRNTAVNTIFTIVAALTLMSSGLVLSGSIFYLLENYEQVIPALSILGYTPLGAGFAAPYLAITSGVGAALVSLGCAAAYCALGWWFWGRRLKSDMRNVGAGQRASTKSLASGELGLLSRFPATAVGAVAARTVHYAFKDMRIVIQLPMMFFMYLIFGLFLGTMNTNRSGEGFVTAFALTEASPMAALNPAVFFATVLCGFSVCNMVSYDNSAFSLHVLAPISGRQDRAGRALGALCTFGLVVVMGVTSVTAIKNAWAMYPWALAQHAGIFLGVSGICLVADTLVNPPVPPPGQNPFATTRQGNTLSKQLMLMAVMAVSSIAGIPAYVCSAVGALSGNSMWFMIGAALQLVIGALLLWGGIVLGGKSYDKRSSRMLQRVSVRAS